jgi:hypothetical protein
VRKEPEVEGVYRCAAGPVLFDAGDGPVEMDPMTLGVLGSCEAWILLSRRSLAEQAEDVADATGMTDEQRDKLRWKAYETLKKDRTLRVVSADELFDWLYTEEGVRHSAYWCLKRDGGPRFATLVNAGESVRSLGLEWAKGFVRARDAASGTDLLSSLDWSKQAKGSTGKAQSQSWRMIYRRIGEHYCWPPSVMNALTLYAVNLYGCEEKVLGGTTKVGFSDFMGSGMGKRRVGG